MLQKIAVRKFNAQDCQEHWDRIEAEQALTGIRLSRLQARREREPSWQAYDKYADDMVGIDIRIEEQHAVAEMLDDELKLIVGREEILKTEERYPSYAKTPKERKRWDEFNQQCQDNEAKGLTKFGFTKAFEGESSHMEGGVKVIDSADLIDFSLTSQPADKNVTKKLL